MKKEEKKLSPSEEMRIQIEISKKAQKDIFPSERKDENNNENDKKEPEVK